VVPGKSGQFDVELDGRLVFSKKDAGRFPEHDEILIHLPA
jgi:selT/selW/selH-like putative selenoprotein